MCRVRWQRMAQRSTQPCRYSDDERHAPIRKSHANAVFCGPKHAVPLLVHANVRHGPVHPADVLRAWSTTRLQHHLVVQTVFSLFFFHRLFKLITFLKAVYYFVAIFIHDFKFPGKVLLKRQTRLSTLTTVLKMFACKKSIIYLTRYPFNVP